MTSRDNITDILCIGCQKGSTSWLHSALNRHPDTWSFPDSEPVTSTCKEAHYWDRNRHRGESWYRDLMAAPDGASKTLDFTPEYAALPDEAIADCKRLNPTARVIYILRDPLARAVSALRMHLLWRFGPDYAQPLRLGDLFFNLMQAAQLDQHGSYVRNWAAWHRHYPDLLVLSYEGFHADRAAGMARVMGHAGLDPARMSDADRARFDQVMTTRIWVSEKFPIDRDALLFLHGFTWRTRLAVERALGLTFAEGQHMIDAT